MQQRGLAISRDVVIGATDRNDDTNAALKSGSGIEVVGHTRRLELGVVGGGGRLLCSCPRFS